MGTARERSQNLRRIDLKRKVFCRGATHNFKRFKRTPKYARDNPENKIAREKETDPYHFSASDDDDDDLGMGLDITDLLAIESEANYANKQKQAIAMTQAEVRPLFTSEADYDITKVEGALVELRYSSFRANQKETIDRILHGRSTLFISPTGSGKSLCYQLPALLYWKYRGYITIVVSPLISLMEDQMSNFPSALKAVSLHSGHHLNHRRKSIQQLFDREAQVVFISPEAIVGGILELEDLKNLPPVGFVCIDEAHCLSEWSHNFRPAYLQFFKILNEHLQIKTFLGLTATSTRATSFAIARCLTINPETDVIGETKVPDNLILSVSHEHQKARALIHLLKSPTFRIMTSIIVYCNRREETENVASVIRTAMKEYKTLIKVPERRKRGTGATISGEQSPEKAHMTLGWNAEAYHAGLPRDTRRSIQTKFVKGEVRVVVATIAFGMGINKADVRAIIHYDMPGSFESYMQEIGRAGRDGHPAQCHMFLKSDKSDMYFQQRNIYGSVTDRTNLRKLVDLIFKSCRCKVLLKEPELAKLDRLNQTDPHEVSSQYKTDFTNLQKDCNDEDIDDYQLISNESEENCDKNGTSRLVKFVHSSVVEKHRACKGHEVAFELNDAALAVDLNPETIITLLCQLQQAYPQLQIKQHTPMRQFCKITCHKGVAQMQRLKSTDPVVGTAFLLKKLENRRDPNSSENDLEVQSRFCFNLVDVAKFLSKPSGEVIRMLKKLEWELVDETGNFRKSQVSVKFSGNAFHLNTVGDLSPKELDELHKFLVDYTHKYEIIGYNKISKMHNLLKAHSIAVENMGDKIIRLKTSAKLKAALNEHFSQTVRPRQSPDDENQKLVKLTGDENDESKLSEQREREIKLDARAFISAHGRKHSPLAIAKIFQGISTPNNPSEYWGPNKKWWRRHPDVDFSTLESLIRHEYLHTYSEKVSL